MNALQKIWYKFYNIGVESDYSDQKKSQISILNLSGLITILFAATKCITEFLEADYMGCFFASCFVVFMAIPIVLNYFRLHKFANWLLLTLFILGICAIKITYGSATGSDFSYMIIMVLSMVLFRDKKQLFFAFTFILVGYVAGVLSNNYYGPLLEIQATALSSYHFFFASSAICSMLIFYWSQKKERQQIETNNLLINELEEKQIENESYNKDLEMVNKELERFVYMASHDLKTPLRNINSFLGLIKLKLQDEPSEEVNEYLDFATSYSKKMYELIDDILNYSKLSDNKQKSEYIDLNELLKEVKMTIQLTIKESNATIVAKNLPAIYSDKIQTTLLFQNLIENGIKYNRSKNPLIEIEGIIADESFKIQFTDNGIGIDEQYHKQIFEMFNRLHNSTEFSGSGIGLATCKRIAFNTGGDITIKSKENEGTTFTVKWPKSIIENNNKIAISKVA